jgi:hypothetical protein
MDTVLKSLIGSEWWIFVDDVIISKSAEEHAQSTRVAEVREGPSAVPGLRAV